MGTSQMQQRAGHETDRVCVMRVPCLTVLRSTEPPYFYVRTNFIGNGNYFHLSSLTLKIHEQWLFSCALVTQPNLMLAISLQWMKYIKSIGYIMRTSGPFQDSSKRYSMTHTLLK